MPDYPKQNMNMFSRFITSEINFLGTKDKVKK